ncbi:MAG TPA: HEAT repeat domain-containing protein [Rhabdochlamydiaceae bacterium]|jgi:HEAT repeat protein
MQRKIAALSLIVLFLFSQQSISLEKGAVCAQNINKLHILYLLRTGAFDKSLELYQEYHQSLGRHDFEVIQQIAAIILDQGVKSHDLEIQLTSIFGSKIAGISTSIDVLETAIISPHPQTQLAAIQLLGSIQDDHCEELLTKAMSSDFFYTRMEAALQLALRKSRTAVGQIESLMYKVPPVMRFFFPQFFALIGTNDAICILRALMNDAHHATRIESILNAARFGRDDLLPLIRSKATHLNVAEQEACASAFGFLKDSQSLSLLHKLSASPSENVKLAALHSLHLLGNEKAKQEISTLAKNKNLFAIALLADIADSEETLVSLMNSQDLQLRFNAAVSLLKRRDPRCKNALKEFLMRDSRDLGFQPQFSVGNSLMSWKVIPSALQHQKEDAMDILTLTLHVKEYLLKECLELPPDCFLEIASYLFAVRQNDLVPLLIALLENLNTPEAIHFLESHAQMTGAPLIRMYCNLALYRLKPKEAQESAILQWISMKKETEMIRFRPLLPINSRVQEIERTFDLTPEENSRLLVESYQTFAFKHDNKGIDILLEGLKTGHPKNRPVLAGLLIQAIQ